MGKTIKAAARLAFSLWIGIGLAACSYSQPATPSPTMAIIPATVTLPAAVILPTATDIPQSPIPSATSLPSPTLTPTGTASPIPSTPSALPPSPTQPAPTLTPTALACSNKPGRVETGSITSGYLQSSLYFHIYLPSCYDEQPERRYPVLYLIHGLYYTDSQWVRLGVPETCDALVTAGQVSPFLVVMPRDPQWKRPSKDMFGQALIDELIPWVEAHYRTLPGRQNRAIGGLSRGAAWAIHLGLTRWDLFGTVGAHSLPVFLEDETDIKNWIDQIPIESFPRLYIDAGDQDSPEVLESALWLEQILTEKGIPHEWHLFAGTHDETYWHAHVEQYLRWYAAGW